ncbi:LysR substrate-binding domain-containing protein [Variovorax terrae]|uniref:LysR substrate-binding domain-containing protein n=1 Tax=Variovorax terrae TaxID=2923278 RepID=A0A9X1W1B2_9BURK|nr:LysR substrate-binding domain-containing protein [Variovorax terrae]MCJ0765902.1 LysR substrate-binding domain-containing protein [Variovorax terrae]
MAARIHIPSTTMLRIFESTARHLSVTRAADEMFLTQSAISKQIKALEDQLGRTLFIRLNRGLALTSVGESYYREIAPLLVGLERATERVVDCASVSKLTLHVFATLGERWLLERFPSFAERHPDIEVRFTAMLSSDGARQSEIDGEFRFGNGLWQGHEADYLFGREMLLVASPSLLKRVGDLRTPFDLMRYPWLQHFQVPHAWDELIESTPELAAATKAGPAPQASMYEFYNVLIRAAIAGLGLALVPRVWVRNELASGELVNPLCLGVSSKYGYYFVVPEHKVELSSVQAFRLWLREEARHTQTKLIGRREPLAA